MTYGTTFPTRTFQPAATRRRQVTNHGPGGFGVWFSKLVEAFRTAHVAPPTPVESAYAFSFATRVIPRN